MGFKGGLIMQIQWKVIWQESREEFMHWFIIIMIIVWFFFILDIATRQAAHEEAVESGHVFYAPEGDGFFNAVITDEDMRG